MTNRPSRLLYDKVNKLYYIKKGNKKKYINTNIQSNKQIVKVIINNHRAKAKRKGKKGNKKGEITKNIQPIDNSNLKYLLLNKDDSQNIANSRELQTLKKELLDLKSVKENEKDDIQTGIPIDNETLGELNTLYEHKIAKKKENPALKEKITRNEINSAITFYRKNIKKEFTVEDIIEHILLDRESRMKGSGYPEDGLTNHQLDDMCKDIPDYKGAIALDELSDMPISKNMCGIINTDPSNKGGRHWRAYRVDSGDKSIEFYDPLVENEGGYPEKQIMKSFKKIIDKLNPSEMYKFKVNKIVNQDDNTSSCGFMCIKFLMDREKGIPFAETTGYKSKEKECDKMANRAKKFGYI
jgi:hypothetical protein